MARRKSLSAAIVKFGKDCRKLLPKKQCAELVRLATASPEHKTFRVDYRRPASQVPMYKRAGKQLRGIS